MIPEDGAPAAAEGARLLPAMDPSTVTEAPPVDAFRRQTDDLVFKTDVLEKRMDDVVGLQLDDYQKLNDINKELDELRNMVVQRCRKMITGEKKKLAAGLCQLSPDVLSKALDLVVEDNPSFDATADEVVLDMDAQSETTLWRLNLFVREALERKANVARASGKRNANANRKRNI